jgi:hypothetical protein
MSESWASKPRAAKAVRASPARSFQTLAVAMASSEAGREGRTEEMSQTNSVLSDNPAFPAQSDLATLHCW